MASAFKEPEVVVIGAGLAGLVVARELRAHKLRVRILEASHRTGGKAGSDQTQSGDLLDHGYHVFPGWYANTRSLLEELGALDGLEDLDRVHYIKRGEFPAVHTLWEMSSLRNLWANLRSGLVPPRDAILASFYGLELALQKFARRGFLDRVSANGFLRSRWYASEALAEVHQHFVLQASSIPNYELSAMTARRISQVWFRTPTPLLSILKTDLQKGLVQPLEFDLRLRGARIDLGRAVTRLCTDGNRVTEVETRDGPKISGDIFVLATPFEVTDALVDEDLLLAEESAGALPEPGSLADLVHLESAPMAALHVFFRRKLPGLPREHTVLFGSSSQISFIDISQWWPRYSDQTVLSAIVSDFGPHLKFSNGAAKRRLIAEMREHLHPLFEDADVDWQRSELRSHRDTPLFINTVGSWRFRPGARTRIPNLFIAGDYCRSTADLTSMESAIESGLNTARALLESLGIDAESPARRLNRTLPARFRWLRRLLVPAVWLLSRRGRSRFGSPPPF